MFHMLNEDPGGISFSEIGGLSEQIRELREVIELPLTNPELFIRVGIKPPKVETQPSRVSAVNVVGVSVSRFAALSRRLFEMCFLVSIWRNFLRKWWRVDNFLGIFCTLCFSPYVPSDLFLFLSFRLSCRASDGLYLWCDQRLLLYSYW